MLKGRVYLLAGANRQAPPALTAALQSAGARVAAPCPGAYFRVSFDAQSPRDAARAVHEAAAALGRLDGAVILPGEPQPFSIEKGDPADFLAAVNDNARAAFILTQAAGGYFRGQRAGTILYVTSIHAEKPTACAAGFSAGCAAVKMLAREAALELGAYNVGVLGIEAGALAGDEKVFHSELTGLYEVMDRKLPARRPGSWQDVGDLAALLLSNRCRHVQGAFLRMDGAFTDFYIQPRDMDDDRVEGVTLYGL